MISRKRRAAWNCREQKKLHLQGQHEDEELLLALGQDVLDEAKAGADQQNRQEQQHAFASGDRNGKRTAKRKLNCSYFQAGESCTAMQESKKNPNKKTEEKKIQDKTNIKQQHRTCTSKVTRS